MEVRVRDTTRYPITEDEIYEVLERMIKQETERIEREQVCGDITVLALREALMVVNTWFCEE